MKLLEILELSGYLILGSGIGTFVSQELFKHRLKKQFYRFSKLYSDKLEIIRIFYQKLVLTGKALDKFMRQREPNEDIEKKHFRNETLQIINDFIEYYEINEIVFDEKSSEIIEQILRDIEESKKLQSIANNLENDRGNEAWLKAVTKKQEYYEKFVINEFPNLKNKLKKEFQSRYKLLLK